ncbi:hypothetical protein, partial [Aquabacterium sp.]|uniref:hypothetical protein n=1 Tax=Aquabacterium sp. TaxID=1872578 RepID=UPI0025C18576
DWYDRIHLIPGVLALGNLVQAQQRTIEVWNAWFVPQRLVSVAGVGTDGLTLTEPVAAPTTFGGLESRLYTLSISLVGPPTIDAGYTFSFVGLAPQAPVLRVTGARVIGFCFQPNWRTPLVERLVWLTDVIRRRNGSEQRVQLRSIPRREFEYLVTLTDTSAARLDAVVWGWQARVFAVPVWTDPTVLAAALPAGSTSVPVTTALRDYAAGALAALVQDDYDHEIVEVLSVAGGSITLARPTTQDWPAGTHLYPARLARMGAQVRINRPTAAVIEASISLQVEPLQPLAGITGPAPATYRGADAYLTAPNRVDALDDDITRALEIIDSQTGPWAVDDPEGRPDIVRSYAWLLADRAAISAHKAWLMARAGRLSASWVPTFSRDMELLEQAGGTSTVLIIRDIYYRNQYALADGRRDIAVRLPSGTWALRRIVAADQVVDGQERIQIDSALGVTVDPGVWICLLGLHRLDGDRVELAWHSPEVVAATANLRLVPA